MLSTVFREYDIRGIVGSELDVEQVAAVAHALAVYFLQKKPSLKTVAVGMDGRLHSPAIKQELCRGFLESGLDVVFLGTCTSPALYFALHAQPFVTHLDAGVMITASHNPKEYNGLKICLGKDAVYGQELAKVRDLFMAGAQRTSDTPGDYREAAVIPHYASWLVKKFSHLKGMSLSILVDCGNGAAGTVLPDLLRAFEWPNVSLLFAAVDGTYPNHEADPTVEKNMRLLREQLQAGDYTCGIGLDGDCDRMAPMTREGVLVPGDQLLWLFAHYLSDEDKKRPVVFDVKASSGLLEQLSKEGMHGSMSQTGHALIKMNMKREKSVLGGELSCHFVFGDRYFGYDDGIYAMLRLIEILVKTGKELSTLLADFPQKITSPEMRITCKEDDKRALVAAVADAFKARQDVSCCLIDGVRASFSYGWGLIRASNTQPKIGVRFEADTPEDLLRVKREFYTILKPFFDDQFLAQELALTV